MSRFRALNKYWSDHPPMHIMVAGYLGIKPKETGNLAELAAMFSGGSVK